MWPQQSGRRLARAGHKVVLLEPNGHLPPQTRFLVCHGRAAQNNTLLVPRPCGPQNTISSRRNVTTVTQTLLHTLSDGRGSTPCCTHGPARPTPLSIPAVDPAVLHPLLCSHSAELVVEGGGGGAL